MGNIFAATNRDGQGVSVTSRRNACRCTVCMLSQFFHVLRAYPEDAVIGVLIGVSSKQATENKKKEVANNKKRCTSPAVIVPKIGAFKHKKSRQYHDRLTTEHHEVCTVVG